MQGVLGWHEFVLLRKRVQGNKEQDISWMLRAYMLFFCAIWYCLYNFKNMKSTHGGVLLLVLVFFTCFKLVPKYATHHIYFFSYAGMFCMKLIFICWSSFKIESRYKLFPVLPFFFNIKENCKLMVFLWKIVNGFS